MKKGKCLSLFWKGLRVFSQDHATWEKLLAIFLLELNRGSMLFFCWEEQHSWHLFYFYLNTTIARLFIRQGLFSTDKVFHDWVIVICTTTFTSANFLQLTFKLILRPNDIVRKYPPVGNKLKICVSSFQRTLSV